MRKIQVISAVMAFVILFALFGPVMGLQGAVQPVKAGPIDPDTPLPTWFEDQLLSKPCQSASFPDQKAGIGRVACEGFGGVGSSSIRIPEVGVMNVFPRYGLVGIPRAFSYRIDPASFDARVIPAALIVSVDGVNYRLANYRVALMLSSGMPGGFTRYGDPGYGGAIEPMFELDAFTYGNIRFRTSPNDGNAGSALNWMPYTPRRGDWSSGSDKGYFGWRTGPVTPLPGLSELPNIDEIEYAVGVVSESHPESFGSYWGAPIYDLYWAMPYFAAIATTQTSWDGAATRNGQPAFAVEAQTYWTVHAKSGWDSVEEWQHVDDDCTYPTPTPWNPNPPPTSCDEVWDWVEINPSPTESDWTYVGLVQRHMLVDYSPGGLGGVSSTMGLEFFQSQPLLTDR